ncbi:MAG: HepT-like ribonuclease domain-containing protein [Promethearchaeota archaeon]|jgi:hypothetical protein
MNHTIDFIVSPIRETVKEQKTNLNESFYLERKPIFSLIVFMTIRTQEIMIVITSSHVIHKFEIIGEATKNIPEVIREQCPQIPWEDIAGMPDKLIHTYSAVDQKLV